MGAVAITATPDCPPPSTRTPLSLLRNGTCTSCFNPEFVAPEGRQKLQLYKGDEEFLKPVLKKAAAAAGNDEARAGLRGVIKSSSERADLWQQIVKVGGREGGMMCVTPARKGTLAKSCSCVGQL